MTDLESYIRGLVIGRGRRAGQPFGVLPWQRRVLREAFGQLDDVGLTLGRGGGKSTLIATLSAACVDRPQRSTLRLRVPSAVPWSSRTRNSGGS